MKRQRNPKFKSLSHLNLCQESLTILKGKSRKMMKRLTVRKSHRKYSRKQKSLLSETDDLEQYSRRNCLVLHGVNESNEENTNEIIIKTFSEEIGVEIKEDDLDRSHRLGKPKRKDNKP